MKPGISSIWTPDPTTSGYLWPDARNLVAKTLVSWEIQPGKVGTFSTLKQPYLWLWSSNGGQPGAKMWVFQISFHPCFQIGDWLHESSAMAKKPLFCDMKALECSKPKSKGSQTWSAGAQDVIFALLPKMLEISRKWGLSAGWFSMQPQSIVIWMQLVLKMQFKHNLNPNKTYQTWPMDLRFGRQVCLGVIWGLSNFQGFWPSLGLGFGEKTKSEGFKV